MEPITRRMMTIAPCDIFLGTPAERARGKRGPVRARLAAISRDLRRNGADEREPFLKPHNERLGAGLGARSI